MDENTALKADVYHFRELQSLHRLLFKCDSAFTLLHITYLCSCAEGRNTTDNGGALDLRRGCGTLHRKLHRPPSRFDIVQFDRDLVCATHHGLQFDIRLVCTLRAKKKRHQPREGGDILFGRSPGPILTYLLFLFLLFMSGPGFLSLFSPSSLCRLRGLRR